MTETSRSGWDLRFIVEVAARYHDWRRATLGHCFTFVKGATLLGAILALVTLNLVDAHIVALMSLIAAAIGIVSMVDLVFGFDAAAREHDELFRRCKELQGALALRGLDSDVADLESQAQLIWRDEPPIYWAIYAMCWNRTAERHKSGIEFKKKVGPIRQFLGVFIQYAPQDFRPTAS